MVRKTWRVNGEARMLLNGVEVCGPDVEHLAAYEDIGLLPNEMEQIVQLARADFTQRLTQSDLDKMHFERVCIDYGTEEGDRSVVEDGVVLYGKLYSIDALDGAGLEELLLDAVSGETLDNPTGTYNVYRRPTNGKEIKGCHD